MTKIIESPEYGPRLVAVGDQDSVAYEACLACEEVSRVRAQAEGIQTVYTRLGFARRRNITVTP